MKILVLAVGKLKDPSRDLADVYLGRIKHHCKIEEKELKSETHLLGAIPKGYRSVMLTERGTEYTSQAFAAWLEKKQDQAQDLAFLIGGAFGFPSELKCDEGLALSKMIFPHRLARVLLYEQIYRAYSIIKNEPYSH